MSFLESPQFPGLLAIQANRTVKHSVEVGRTYNRRAIKNINTAQGWREYSFPMPAKSTAEFAVLEAHYLAVKGMGHQFRFADKHDKTATQTDGYLGQSSAGTGVPTYQLHKRYSSGSFVEFRSVKKPISSGLGIYRNASIQTAGAGAGNYALDSTTGIVTFVADGSSGAVSHTVGASHQVTLSAAIAGLAIGGKLYLTGVTGTAAATLNSIAHTIANIVGATYTLSTVTTGLVATGGTGFKYPQPTDTLAWAGDFDTPVSYGSELTFTAETGNILIAQQVLLIEEAV